MYIDAERLETLKVNIIIDGESFTISPTQVDHLIEFLRIVHNQYILQDRFIQSMAINEQISDRFSEPLIRQTWASSKELVIQIQTADAIHAALHSIDQMHQVVTKLMYDVSLCSEYFQLNTLDKADRYWAYNMETIHWLLKELYEVDKWIGPAKSSIPALKKTDSLPQIQQRLQNISVYMAELYAKEDYLTLGRVLEVDLCAYLGQLQRTLEDLVPYQQAA